MKVYMGLFDQIKNAQFINETITMKQDLEELKEILSKVGEGNRSIIEQEIRNLEYGKKGEEAIVYELKHSGIPMLVIQDLYLEYEDISAQIDFLLITRDKNYIIECKNMYGDVLVEETGDFMRKFGRETRKVYSPVTQCERHMQVIRALRKSSKGVVTGYFFEKNFENNYISIVVMANPTGKIHIRNAPKDIKHKIISVDQLVRFIKNHNTSKELRSERDMKSLAEYFLSVGKESPRNYMEQYRKLVELEVDSVPTDVVTIEEVEKVCSRCGSEMVQRVAKRGDNAGNRFWGCSRYPKCRYIEVIDR